MVRFDTLGTTFIPRIFEAKDWANLFENFEDLCREGKILDLSQADTTYYQVHKIQPIAKHHVLLLGFAITTQKPTEIAKCHAKNQSCINARVSDDTSNLARVSDDTGSLARVSDDINGPIRL